jgi:uncharacterized protein (DUF427 family)
MPYPAAIAPVGHVEPVPRRIRAIRGGDVVVDTTAAHYVWEWPHFPQYYIPRGDVRDGLLVPGPQLGKTSRGTIRTCSFADAGPQGPTVARLLVEATNPALTDTLRFEWEALDAWFEEDEQVFVHPRNPYTRVDAVRSTRSVRIELEGVVLAESASPVLVFETGLPTRYYLNRTEVRFEHLEFSPTVTRCPYKGTTTGYWSVVIGGDTRSDLAWTYDFPTRELSPIAGLVSFYNEKVDVFVDGVAEERPVTHFSD